MSKMNFKSTLWALAFACAAVSCSDELENGPNNNEGNEEQGEGVYLTVNIASSSTGAMTKADNPAEDGSADPLQGSTEERKINDINLYLIKASDIQNPTSITSVADGVSIASVSGEIAIVGHGYSNDITETGHISDHTANTVMIEIDQKDIQNTENSYYVFAVANLGKKVSFSTLGNLRDAVKAPSDSGTDWDGKVWTGAATYGKATNFVMSTHQMYDSNIQEPSSVTISTANMDPNNPATATVYVERLAARIDMKVAADFTNNEGNGKEVVNSIKVEDENGNVEKNAKDFVKLTGYQVVNRWKGDEYLLKRVTQEVTRNSAAAEYPAIPTTDPAYKYLGDEIWVDGSTTWKYNYVIDPKTSDKDKESIDGFANSYDSHYDDDLNNDLTTAFTSIEEIEDDAFTPVIYTKENTLDLDNQVLGLVTGVIFEGTYTPNAVSRFKTNGGDSQDQTGVFKDDFNVDSDKGFYVVNDHNNKANSRYICADLTTIGALAFENIKSETWATTFMKALFTVEGQWGNLTLENIKSAVEKMKGGKLAAAYQDFLEKKLENITELSELEVGNLKWSKFITDTSISDPKNVTENFGKVSKVLYDNYNIGYYAGGVCYYPYWIRHEDNGNDSSPAPMEFCIVRNNVYQLDVTGVNALGYPLPFIDDEETPVEDQTVYLTVEIYVKDWVVRSNDNIIL